MAKKSIRVEENEIRTKTQRDKMKLPHGYKVERRKHRAILGKRHRG